MAALVLLAVLAPSVGARGAEDTAALAARGPDVVGGYASSHVVVCVKPGVVAGHDRDGRPVLSLDGAGDAESRRMERRVAATLDRFRASRVVPAMPAAPAARAEDARRRGLDRVHRLMVEPGTDLPAFVRELRTHGDLFDYAELDPIGAPAEIIPDDEFFVLQYGLWNFGQTVVGQVGVAGADIRATLGWDVTTGSDTVRLAVLDAGLDAHVELDGRTVPGWNVVSDNADTTDVCGSHGTHVAGIAAANADGAGTVGVDWACQVMPVRVFDSCVGTESSMAAGITWATDNGAHVINISAQYPVGTATLLTAVQYAYDAGVVIVAAAGNEGFSGGVAFPARWPETIAVAATDNQDSHWIDSNTGPEVTVAAPGLHIWSLSGSASYVYRTGTSMATPHVAGLATLMLAIDDTLTTDEVRDILICTATDVDAPGFDEQTGYGRIDADRALRATVEGIRVAGDANGDGIVDTQDLLIVLGAWGPCPDPPMTCPGDVVFDGVVDVQDLLHVFGNWG